jgi:ribosomal protein S18 acetylase RimI-like enzyme
MVLALNDNCSDHANNGCWRLRLMRAADLADIMDIENEAFDSPYPVSFFTKALRKGRTPLVVATRLGDGAIGGYIAYYVSQEQFSQGEVVIVSLVVSSLHRRKGLGELLLRHAIGLPSARFATLHVSVFNHAALLLYQKMQFSAARWLPRYYSATEDALLMLRTRVADSPPGVPLGPT